MRDQRQQTAMVMVPMLGDQPRYPQPAAPLAPRYLTCSRIAAQSRKSLPLVRRLPVLWE